MKIEDYIKHRTYHFRIKTIVPVEDDTVDRIERALAKYDIVDISRPRKTIFQSQPLDFSFMESAEVYIIDVEVEMPASAYVITQELRVALGIPEKYIVVRGDNDPLELQTERLNANLALNDEAKREGLENASHLEASENQEAEDRGELYYGDSYNSRLMHYLKAIQEKGADARKDDPLFSWMNNREEQDFNDGYRIEDDGALPHVSPHGNLDDENRTVNRLFRDKTGKTVIKSLPYDPIRKRKENKK